MDIIKIPEIPYRSYLKAEMKFRIEGRKAHASSSYISETDLLTLPRKNIRLRQRYLNCKVLAVKGWENKSPKGERYTSATVDLFGVFAN